MAHNYIIQWNCRGLRSNREDIELLISKYSPAAICLQETMLTPHQGWGQVLFAVLESSTSTFQICKYKYKYSKYLIGIKYIKYFFDQVQVQVQVQW